MVVFSRLKGTSLMDLIAKQPWTVGREQCCLSAYVLGLVDFPNMLQLQRSLVYQVQEDRSRGFLVLCEQAPIITVGRQAGPGQIQFDCDDLLARRWPVRWVNRGGGCWLHLPGQMAAYSVLALDKLGLGIEAYVEKLQRLVVRVLEDFTVHANLRPGQSAIEVGGRPIAEIGLAVRDWVAYFGLVLNVNPDLTPYRHVRLDSGTPMPMTSLERERRGPLRPGMVRERFLEYYAAAFGFGRTSLFSHHPRLPSVSRVPIAASTISANGEKQSKEAPNSL